MYIENKFHYRLSWSKLWSITDHIFTRFWWSIILSIIDLFQFPMMWWKRFWIMIHDANFFNPWTFFYDGRSLFGSYSKDHARSKRLNCSCDCIAFVQWFYLPKQYSWTNGVTITILNFCRRHSIWFGWASAGNLPLWWGLVTLGIRNCTV